MDVAKKVQEFIALNTKAKTCQLSDEEFQRWVELKDGLINDISREAAPTPPPEAG